ncbi:ABC transporter ATP-binding protein [Halalkalibacter flavus]|uniref:ABC transporter ATP-binding protein n=1 Tax=Halalkalibacter flavus TaxID=3090668 RepID=UPI002FC93D44
MFVVENLSYKANNKLILKNINFELKENSITSIVGPNGAGKTTLIEVMAGVKGKLTGTTRKYRVVYINPDMLILNFLTAKEYIDMIINLNNVEKAEYEESFSIFESLHINDFWDTRIEFLSLGQKQKLMLLVGVLSKPDILLFDEPFNALDINAYHQAIKIFSLFKEKFSIFFSTHELDGLSEVCDKIIYIQNGAIKKQLTKENGDLKDDNEFIQLFRG